jgi:alkaline phosphatase D
VNAIFFGNPSLQTSNGCEVSLANFTVVNGGNRLSKPVAGGSVEDGSLRDGQITMSKLTVDTNTGKYFTHNFTRVTLKTSYDD